VLVLLPLLPPAALLLQTCRRLLLRTLLETLLQTCRRLLLRTLLETLLQLAQHGPRCNATTTAESVLCSGSAFAPASEC
jgi:hypothetical protein